MNVLIATEKPFAKAAVDGIRKIVEGAGHQLSLLEKYSSAAEFHAAVANADALIVRSDKVTADVVAAAPKLKIVVRAGAGFDNLDLAACSAKNIVCMNTPGQNSNAVAELVLGMMVLMARNQYQSGTGVELKGKKIGIHAYGNVGRLVAGIAKGFGMDVYAFDPFVKAENMAKDGVHVCEKIEDLYSTCDYVSLHIPATPQTVNSIGRNLISRMPKGACLINTARKEVIHEAELMEILGEREDLKYATDIAAGNQAQLSEKYGKRVFGTPKKMGAETAEANINAGLAAANQICNFFKNGDETFRVNK